jgi:hypothetical protein
MAPDGPITDHDRIVFFRATGFYFTYDRIEYYIVFLATASLQGSSGRLHHLQPDEPPDEPPLHEEAKELAELAA